MTNINKVYLSGEAHYCPRIIIDSKGIEFSIIHLCTIERPSLRCIEIPPRDSIPIIFDLSIFCPKKLPEIYKGSKISIEGSLKLFFTNIEQEYLNVVMAVKWEHGENKLGRSWEWQMTESYDRLLSSKSGI